MREKLTEQGYDKEAEYFRKQEKEALEKMRKKKQEKEQSEKAGD
jgi:hypothetical protein